MFDYIIDLLYHGVIFLFMIFAGSLLIIMMINLIMVGL